MRLKPGSRGLTILLAMMTGLGPLSTDIYLASMPFIGAALNASASAVQLTMSAYVIGFAFGQIIYGPLSDKYGRRPVLLTGFAIYLAATFACIFASTIETLITARIIQSLGAAGPIILARAIVRDLYEGAQAGRQLALMSTIVGFTPIGAPVLGGVLQAFFDWHASFVAMLMVAGILAFVVLLLLPETNHNRQEGPLSPRSILTSFGEVAKNHAFRTYAGMQALSYCGLFAFLSGSSYVLQKVYGFDSISFGLMFACCSVCYVSGAYIGARMVARRGLDGMIARGVAIMGFGGMVQLASVVVFPNAPLAFIIPEMIYFFGLAFIMPNTVAAAMSPFPERAGAASSLMGFVQMSAAALVAWAMALFLSTSAIPVAIVMAISGASAFALFHLTKHLR
jgi:DHA1 family bicyclomycin/chloramphenicol resistance-like MFS transporter